MINPALREPRRKPGSIAATHQVRVGILGSGFRRGHISNVRYRPQPVDRVAAKRSDGGTFVSVRSPVAGLPG